MSDPTVVFVCRRSSDTLRCSTTGCGGIVVERCTFALRGRLEGKTCDRALCVKCSGGKKLCLAHQRVSQP